MPDHRGDQPYTKAEAADLFRCSEWQVGQMIRDGRPDRCGWLPDRLVSLSVSDRRRFSSAGRLSPVASRAFLLLPAGGRLAIDAR